MEKTYLEDFSIGETLTTPGRTITETDIVHYAMLTGDWHPVHTDATYAEQTQFGERIAHGMLTLIIGSTLVHRMGPYVYVPKGFIAFYGIEKARFLHPVKIGDTLHAVIRVDDLIPKDERRGTIQYHEEIRNQDDTVVLTWISRMLVERRPVEQR